MAVITESSLRSLFRENPFTTYVIEEGQLITPSATQFLRERRVEIKHANKIGVTATVPAGSTGSKATSPTAALSQNQKSSRYISAVDGGRFDTKPEHMTQLRGNQLVAKDHDRIIFRGKLDSFQSSILNVQTYAYESKKMAVVHDLEDVLNRVREIMKADVMQQPLEDATLLGITADKLRQWSHNPKKYFGIDHITPHYSMGRLLVELNQLRSNVREVEASAVRAFRTEFEVQRTDIITALNRMSSVLYVMMIKEKSGNYIESQPGLKK